ncbi:MAG TPA: hypothetical protein VH740_09190 [Vicinamibacterales bacterium]|jgi:hypothetical protein
MTHAMSDAARVRRRTFSAAAAIVAALVAILPSRASAQQLELTISPIIVAFPTSDPDATPVLNAPPLTVRYRVRANGNRPWTLTVLASGTLTSGLSTIPVANETWIAAPSPPFRAGTMSTTQAQTVAAGTGNVNPMQTGTVTFRLTNSWTYDAGTYLQVLTFTLSAP